MKLRFKLVLGGVAGAAVIGIAAALAGSAVAQVPTPSAAGEQVDSSTLGLAVETPLARALQDALSDEPELLQVYAYRSFEPLWIGAEGSLTVAGRALADALADAPRHALPVSRYRNGIAAAQGGDSPEMREIAMLRAYLRYGRDISSGLLEPRSIDRDIVVKPERPDPAMLLLGISGTSDPQAFIAGLAPQSDDYARLLGRLAEMRALAMSGDGWGREVAAGPTLRQGDRDRRVVQLRERLTAMGDLDPSLAAIDAERGGEVVVAANDVTTDAPGAGVGAGSDPMFFDASLAEAVRRFQARHGLNQDGVVGPATLAQLNASPEFRADQIAVNLERIRWLNRDLGQRHVRVNIADFMMRVMEDGKQVFESRVVVGQKRHQTPEFSDMMDHMVINPTWFVPRSIAVNEILPRLREDPSYLERKGYRLSGGADPWMIDWNEVTPATFPGSIRQRPGEGNALGRVKFMFPNDFAIYLHDTPQRHLFAKDVRAFSHGCVRVEKPLEFAYFLLADQEADPRATFDRWLASGRERHVTLDRHLPVHITYRTAWIDDTGRDQFRGDIYDRDAKVMGALAGAGVDLAGG